MRPRVRSGGLNDHIDDVVSHVPSNMASESIVSSIHTPKLVATLRSVDMPRPSISHAPNDTVYRNLLVPRPHFFPSN